MKLAFAHRISIFAAAMLIAVASVMSAARMGPATSDTPNMAVYLASGGTVADLCGDVQSSHIHHCPFCRLLEDPPKVEFAPCAQRLILVLGWKPLSDLTVGPQSGNPHVSARAPPARA